MNYRRLLSKVTIFSGLLLVALAPVSCGESQTGQKSGQKAGATATVVESAPADVGTTGGSTVVDDHSAFTVPAECPTGPELSEASGGSVLEEQAHGTPERMLLQCNYSFEGQLRASVPDSLALVLSYRGEEDGGHFDRNANFWREDLEDDEYGYFESVSPRVWTVVSASPDLGNDGELWQVFVQVTARGGGGDCTMLVRGRVARSGEPLETLADVVPRLGKMLCGAPGLSYPALKSFS